VPDSIGLPARPKDKLDELVGGQPRWYWALPKASKVEVLRERARKAGCEYSECMSHVGLKDDGEPPPKEKVQRESGPRMGRRKRAKFTERVYALKKKVRVRRRKR